MSPRDASTEISLKLSDYKRSMELFLRALWGQTFLIRTAEPENGGVTSYLANGHIHVPVEIRINTAIRCFRPEPDAAICHWPGRRPAGRTTGD
jgi:hypothetical protein